MGGDLVLVARKIELSSEERAVLEQQARGRSLRLVWWRDRASLCVRPTVCRIVRLPRNWALPQRRQIVDNYATHKHRLVKRWLECHPLHVHFTPTSCSWLNMVERFFRDLTEKQLRRGAFRNVEDLLESIGEYIDHHNCQPKPFIWTAKASDILEKVKRTQAALV